jgi:pSer/pThr/pTyr-binding forkhead associated (FHA) protein
MSMGLQLGISYLGGEREYVRVRRWPFSIGRNPGNDLCLKNSGFISRRHAQILKDNRAYKLVALGRNPTFLNGSIVEPDKPIDIIPGDRIELPDYLIHVRSSSRKPAYDPTVNVDKVSATAAVVRRIASQIGVSQWTTTAIKTWLDECPGREVRISQPPATLFLTTSISLEQLEQRLELFDKLISPLDPYSLSIQTVDPCAPTLPPID